jgi:2-haloacid dehalogenase
VWVARKGSPWETFGTDPALTIETFYELAETLGV